jgi:hypothetical protein
MKIELLNNPDMIRKRFIDRFLEDREHFRIVHTDFVEQLDDFDQWYGIFKQVSAIRGL